MTDVAEREQAVVAPVQRRRRRRPPAPFRALAALSGLGAAMFAVALMLSDRAPGVIRALLGDRAGRLWERIDASGRAEFVSASSLPESDQLVHVAVWASVVALGGIAVWSWRGLGVVAVLVGLASAVVESGQGLWSATRTVESSDLAANSVGVALGTVAVAALYALWALARGDRDGHGASPATNHAAALDGDR